MNKYIKILFGFAVVFLGLVAGGVVLASETTGDLNTGLDTGVDGIVVAPPSAAPIAGTYSSALAITLTATGATSMRYSINGTDPTCSTGIVYVEEIAVASSRIIKAISCYPGGIASSVATFIYTISSSSGGGGGGGGGGNFIPAPTPVTGKFSRTEANAKLPPNFPVDSLVKLADDKNPKTDVDSAVYYIGLDAKRHSFINNHIFSSWYSNFDDIKIIDATTLASITLGTPILSRPGTWWVKIASDPKTYYVEPGSYKLRWIKDEATALALGGSDWNKNILDVGVSYFANYSSGDPIDMTYLAKLWPAGALLKLASDTTIWYATGTERRRFASKSAFSANGFQDRFIELNNKPGWQYLPTGADITGFEDALFSLQH